MGGRRLKTLKIEGVKGAKLPAPQEEEVAPVIEEEKPSPGKPKRPKAPKSKGQKYQEASKLINKTKLYPLDEAIALAKKTSPTKFDATLEAHFNLGIDPGKTEQLIRTTVALPHGTGKKVKVLVFAEGEAAKAALSVGADEIGDESTIEKIASSGTVPFDAVIATPSYMQRLAKAARILGPKGLMPNPKSNTVTEDPARLVAELKKGRVTLQTKNEASIHVGFGKVSFPDEHLKENFLTIWEALLSSKPPKVKEPFVKSVFITTTMGPSIKVDIASLS